MPIGEKTARQSLETMRAELSALSGISADGRRPVELDQQSVGRLSRIDAMQMQAMAEATERNRIAELRRIDAALARLADGSFGYCARCDEPIGEKRLAIDPAVPFCVSCAAGSKH